MTTSLLSRAVSFASGLVPCLVITAGSLVGPSPAAVAGARAPEPGFGSAPTRQERRANKVDPELVATWVPARSGQDTLELRADGSFAMGSQSGTWRLFGKRKLRLTIGEDTSRLPFELEGKRLRVNHGTKDTPVWVEYEKRSAPAPKSGRKSPPDSAPAPDPFARTFEGEWLTLTLEPTSTKKRYGGFVRVEGNNWPVSARVTGSRIRGTVDAGDETLRFTGTLDGDVLTVLSDGETLVLQGEPMPEPQPEPQPLPQPGTEGPVRAPVPPPALTGVAKGKTETFKHPKGYFTCEFPKGWSVAQMEGDGMLLNPGLKKDDILSALILVNWGFLDEEECNQPPAKLLALNEREWRSLAAEDGIRLARSKKKPQAVSVEGVPGATQEWSGTLADGRKVKVWVGALVKRDAFLSILTIVLDEEVDRYLPPVKQILTTLRPNPPKRNPVLERQLVGCKIVANNYVTTETSANPAVDATGWRYTFRADGTVESFWYLTGGIGITGVANASSYEYGTYEVIGDQLYIYFPSSQFSGEVLMEGKRPTGIRVGRKTYGL